MLLSAYLAATNQLLQNPVPDPPLYTTSDLTAWINEGRQQLAGDGQCIRAQSSATISAGLQVASFSIFTTFPTTTVASGTVFFPANPAINDTVTLNGVIFTFIAGASSGNNIHINGTCATTIGVDLLTVLQNSVNPSITVATYDAAGGPDICTLIVTYKTAGAAGNAYTLAASAAEPSGPTLSGGSTNIAGIQSVLTIRQLSVTLASGALKLMTGRPWPWFNRYYLSNGAVQVPGVPNTWAQLGLGAAGTFGIAPAPAGTTSLSIDAVCLPTPLTSDASPEAIPYPFTDAVCYYAAYKAYLSSQRTQDATVMFGRYKEFTRRAVEETTPTVLPSNFAGGRGAQMAATKQSLTDVPNRQAQ